MKARESLALEENHRMTTLCERDRRRRTRRAAASNGEIEVVKRLSQQMSLAAKYHTGVQVTRRRGKAGFNENGHRDGGRQFEDWLRGEDLNLRYEV